MQRYVSRLICPSAEYRQESTVLVYFHIVGSGADGLDDRAHHVELVTANNIRRRDRRKAAGSMNTKASRRVLISGGRSERKLPKFPADPRTPFEIHYVSLDGGVLNAERAENRHGRIRLVE